MELVVCPDAPALARAAAERFAERLRARPDLRMAVPAGRTPRGMYDLLAGEHRRGALDCSRMHVFGVDELCPPAPPDGYFWRQVRGEFLGWAGVPAAQQHPFRVDRPDLEAMCRDYEASIGALGGLDLVMLGLGPNGHIASNEPGSPFDSRCRPVRLLPATVRYILTDEVIQGPVADRAVTLGIATILEAREVVVLASGAAKRAPLRRMLEGPITPEVPASALRRHPRCTVLADEAALPARGRGEGGG
jgi:glucosamine-6-phosphate deaminase